MYKCAFEHVESCWTSEQVKKWTSEQVNKWTSEQVHKWTCEQGTCWKVLHLLVRAISAFPAGESEDWTVKFTSSLFQDNDEDDNNDDDE